VECGDPRGNRPTFARDDDGYDRFRVLIGWDPGFGTGRRLTSGDTLLRATSWTPSAKKWREACANARAVDPGNPTLYVKVLGVDTSLPKRSPSCRKYGDVVQVNARPSADRGEHGSLSGSGTTGSHNRTRPRSRRRGSIFHASHGSGEGASGDGGMRVAFTNPGSGNARARHLAAAAPAGAGPVARSDRRCSRICDSRSARC
jgi:hypothetical protein